MLFNQNAELDIPDQSYYRILTEKKSALSIIGHAITFPFLNSFRFTRFITGRFLSYFLLNPLFRKQEQEQTTLVQHPKYPDPALEEQAEITIINVKSNRSNTKQIISNWWHQIGAYLKNSWSFSNSNPPLANQEKNEAIVAGLLEKVQNILEQDPKKSIEQIHFRGLHHLSPEVQSSLFNQLNKKFGYQHEQQAHQYHFYTLQSRQGAELDSVEVRGRGTQLDDISQRKFIISCLPRSNNYIDWMKQHRYYADQIGATVIAFNYRGTGLSKGIISSQHGMKEDVMAQVERLIALGAKPQNIALAGECIGANIATQTAALLHRNQCPVKLYNARSFRSVFDILLGRILPEKNKSSLSLKNLGKWFLAGLATIIIKPLLYLAGWDLSVEKDFISIPPEDRDYLTVRSSLKLQGKRYRDDAMIPHERASIDSLVKDEQQRLAIKKEAGQRLSESENAWLADRRKYHKFFVNPEKRNDARKVDGHTCQPRYLIARSHSKQDGREYALNAFRRLFSSNPKQWVDFSAKTIDGKQYHTESFTQNFTRRTPDRFMTAPNIV